MEDLGSTILGYGVVSGRIRVTIISGFAFSFLGSLTVLNLRPSRLIFLCTFALLWTTFLSICFAYLNYSYDSNLLVVHEANFDSLTTF